MTDSLFHQVIANPWNLKIQQGFTLVEIMVVLVLLSILMGIGYPTLSTWRDDAHLREVTASLRYWADDAQAAYLGGESFSSRNVGSNPWGDPYFSANDSGTGFAQTDVPLTGVAPAGLIGTAITGGTRLSVYGHRSSGVYRSSAVIKSQLYREAVR